MLIARIRGKLLGHLMLGHISLRHTKFNHSDLLKDILTCDIFPCTSICGYSMPSVQEGTILTQINS